MATFIVISAQRSWTWGLSLSFQFNSLYIRDALILTVIPFAGVSNLISDLILSITHCHINLFLLYMSPCEVDTTYDLGVFLPGVNITMAGCHGLTLGFSYNHTDCWWTN